MNLESTSCKSLENKETTKIKNVTMYTFVEKNQGNKAKYW